VEIGKSISRDVILSNPSNQEALIDCSVSSPENFFINRKLVIAPFEEIPAKIHYTPTGLNMINYCDVLF